jgi:hypothetical protein
MSMKQLLAAIDRGISALEKARALCLKGETVAATKVRPGKAAKTAAKSTMSEEGRARIAAAQKKRWAKVKREKNKAAKAARAGA